MWSKNFPFCMECKSTKNKHAAKGLCLVCYLKQYRENPKNKEVARKLKHKWYKENVDFSERKTKREKAHFAGMRERALERDNYSCVICGSREKLVVHHIDGTGRSIKENHNNSLDNLVTLCRKHHIQIHRDDLYNKKRAISLKNSWKDPNRREKAVKVLENSWKDPVIRTKRLKGMSKPRKINKPLGLFQEKIWSDL